MLKCFTGKKVLLQIIACLYAQVYVQWIYKMTTVPRLSFALLLTFELPPSIHAVLRR